MKKALKSLDDVLYKLQEAKNIIREDNVDFKENMYCIFKICAIEQQICNLMIDMFESDQRICKNRSGVMND